MMELEYQLLEYARPVNGLELYCKLEGLDLLHMRSVAEKETCRQIKPKNVFLKKTLPDGK